jgi:hypothetical protein
MSDDIMSRAPDRAEVLKMIQRITKAIGTSDHVTVFVACSCVMQLQAELMGIASEKEKP